MSEPEYDFDREFEQEFGGTRTVPDELPPVVVAQAPAVVMPQLVDTAPAAVAGATAEQEDDDNVTQVAETPESPRQRVAPTPRSEAIRLMSSKERFKESAAQRTAATVWASLEQSEATDRLVKATERQNELLAAQVEALNIQNKFTALLLTENRTANQLKFLGMDVSDFDIKRAVDPAPAADGTLREHPHTQMKRNIGILPPLTEQQQEITATESDEDTEGE